MSAKSTKITSAAAKASATPPRFDWSAMDALTDEEIEAAVADHPDAPPILGPEWFARAELVLPGRKRPISIRLDEDVLAYFMAQGPGYQSRINAVLKHYVRTKRGFEALRGFAARERPEPPARRPRRAARSRKH